MLDLIIKTHESEADKKLHERCECCVEATIGDLNAPIALKIASEMIQRTSVRAFRASGNSWRALNNEKPQIRYCFFITSAPWGRTCLSMGTGSALQC